MDACCLSSFTRRSPDPPSATRRAVKAAAFSRTSKGVFASAIAPTPRRRRFCASAISTARSVHPAPSNTTKRFSLSTKAHQPFRGVRNRQAPSSKAATFPACPAKAPVGVTPTMQRAPSTGAAGGAATLRADKDRWTSTSRRPRASLWVTCFCACAASSRGSARRVVSDMINLRIRGWEHRPAAQSHARQRR